MFVSRYLYSIILFWFLLISCSQQDQHLSIVRIHATNFTNPAVIVYYQDEFGYAGNMLGKGVLDTAGTSTVSIYLDKPAFGIIKIGDESASVYLTPGKDIHVFVDCNAFHETIVFNDNEPGINNLLAERFLIIQQLEDSAGQYLEDPTPADLLRIKNIFLSGLDEQLINYEQLSDDERNLVRLKNKFLVQNILYTVADIYFEGEDREKYTGAYLDTLELKPAYLGISEYTDCLNDFVFAKYFDPFNRMEPNEAELHPEIVLYQRLRPEIVLYQRLLDSELPTAIESYVIGNWMKRMITWKSELVELDSILIDFERRHGTTSNYQVIAELSKKSKSLSPGKLAPNFEGLTPAGDRISLHDLKGKVVYVDIWATWCGPCVSEIPASKKLHQEFLNTDEVVFLFVSIDENKTAWLKWLEKDPDFSGLHIIQEGGWQSEILSTYLLEGIPQYLLFDQQGKIVTTHAPRPSSGKVAELIKELLVSD